MAKFAVIIAAAGKSSRFGGEKGESKVFAKIDGRPVFMRSVELFANREDVCQTILVMAPSDMGELKNRYGANLGFMGVQVVEGGARRCDSVAAGLKALREDAEYVAVHDAARPCTAQSVIDAVFAAAVTGGAAIPASPVTGTLKRVSAAQVVDATVPRESLFEAQTPQVFRREVLLAAYGKLEECADDVTDDAMLVEKTGHPVSVVPADGTNLKITTREDLTLAQAILKARPSKPAPRMGAFEEAQW